MAGLRKIHMPEMTLDLDPDVCIVSRISNSLNKVSIDPSEMLYCGVNAVGFEKARALPPRSETFAVSYDDMLQHAKQYDSSYDFINTHPLAFLRLASRIENAVPALITYDANGLVSPDHSEIFFVPKSGNNVQKAARAILFFS